MELINRELYYVCNNCYDFVTKKPLEDMQMIEYAKIK